MDDFIIDGIWILENDTGICLFEQIYKDFTKKGVSTDLITSFLVALLYFADEAFIDEIQFIKFSKYKIVFEYSDYVFYVIAINDNVEFSQKVVKKKITEIKERFKKNFTKYFEGNWDKNISIFNSFSKDLAQIVKQKPLKIKLIKQEMLEWKNQKQYERRMRRWKELNKHR